MPRLQPVFLRTASRISPHLPTLLPACRDLESAQHELRWIREYVCSLPLKGIRPSHGTWDAVRERCLYKEQRIARLCARRGRGEPLQYVLGSQPFGELDITCRRGVLIPRPETEAYVMYLSGLIRRGTCRGLVSKEDLTVLDLCTGTGCIPLLLYERLRREFSGIRVTGLDISPQAVALSRHNLTKNIRSGLLHERAASKGKVVFEKADIFTDDVYRKVSGGLDVLISNPPYISARGFDCDTGRSVRNYEPKLALVPDEGLKAAATSLNCKLEDVFYARLLNIARELKPKIMLFEVGDMEQAQRVVEMAMRLGSLDDFGYEIWRDEPDAGNAGAQTSDVSSSELVVRGEGHGRSVMVYRKLQS
jgi:HemK-like putative methylase